MKHFCFDTLLSRLCTADNQEHCCLVIIFHQPNLTHDVYSTFPSSPSSWLQISQIATERVISMNFNTKIHRATTQFAKNHIFHLFSLTAKCQSWAVVHFKIMMGPLSFLLLGSRMMGLGLKDENVQKRSPASFDFRHNHCLWKSLKMSHSTLRAKRATVTFWVDKSYSKMPKMVNFWKYEDGS